MGICLRGGEDTARGRRCCARRSRWRARTAIVEQLARGLHQPRRRAAPAPATRTAARALLAEGASELRELGRQRRLAGRSRRPRSPYDLGLWDEADALASPELGRGAAGHDARQLRAARASLSMARGDHADARSRLEVAGDARRALRRAAVARAGHRAAGRAGAARARHRGRARRDPPRPGPAGRQRRDGRRRAPGPDLCAAAGVEADAAQQARDLGRPTTRPPRSPPPRDWAAQAREAASRPFAAAMPEAAALVLVADAEAAAATGTPDPRAVGADGRRVGGDRAAVPRVAAPAGARPRRA